LRRHQLAQMLIIGVIASAIGIAVALSINWFPVQASSQAKKIDDLWDVLLIASVPIFVLVEVVVLYSVWKFRMRPGEELKDGPPIHGNTMLEIIWTAVPALIIFSLVTYAYIVLVDIEKKPSKEMVVQVTGQQFAWSYQYREPGQPIVNTDTLYVPKGESVRFNIKATDVIHDFWVPAFRLKIDAVPGITTHYRVTPVRNGSYAVVCAELCGLGHSTMRSTVHVVDPVTFKGWLAAKRAAKPAGATS
jgi:cytochrome c oxidase subunit II